MCVLILDGNTEGTTKINRITTILEEVLREKSWSYETVKLEEKSITACRGCFGCWLQTPGICIIDDDARGITRKMINSDVVVYLTPIVFGGYSNLLKAQVDRSIGLVHPFFTKIDGETHHRTRYDKYPSIFGIGINEHNDEVVSDLFKKHIHRNSINFHSPKSSSEVLSLSQNEHEVRKALARGLSRLEGGI